MPNITMIVGGGETSDAERAADAWRRINDKPTSVVLVRGQTTLAAQIVRVEYSEEEREIGGGAGISSRRLVIVFGVKDHPEVADTNIQRDDRFAYNDQQFRVLDVVFTLGEKQARCEAMT
jgi:hypothetical protein